MTTAKETDIEILRALESTICVMNEGQKYDAGMVHMKDAEKHLKTTLLKWKPDYDEAANSYSKAAVCFKIGKALPQCREALLKSASCHKEMKSLFQAAKALEQVILTSKEMGDVRDIAKYAEEACALYQQHGSADSGALLLEKAATILQDSSTVDALRLYQHAADVAMIQDNVKQAAEYTSKAARIMVKLQHYDEAVAALRREIGLHQQTESFSSMGRLAVALVLIHLARQDYVAAEKAFKEWGNYCEQAEVQTLEALLQAYDEEDAAGVTEALNSSFIKHMDVEYARLAKQLPLPKSSAAIPPPESIRHNAAPSYVSPNTATIFGESQGTNATREAESPDEYEGGLC